jgi:methionyl aminopeptidase
MAERSCQSAFLGYKGFPGHICISSERGSGPRNRRFEGRQDGDIVKIDVGILSKNGWIGDNARTVAVGGLPPGAERLLAATEESLHLAIEQASEGELLSSVCGAVEAHVSQFGFTVVKQFVGHGVGRKLHEEPQVPNYWDSSEMTARHFKNPAFGGRHGSGDRAHGERRDGGCPHPG